MIDAAAFEALFRAHGAELLGFLIRRGAGSRAEDLLADVFLVAWRRRADLPAADKRRAWLFGTARRLLLAEFRVNPQTSPLPDSVATQPAGHDTPRLGPDKAEAVREALGALSDEDRELITLTTWEGLSPAEAADVLDLKPGTARVRLHRARARLAADPRMIALLEPATRS